MDPGPISLVNSMPPTSHRIASSLNYLVKVLQQIQDAASNLLLVQPCRTGITPYRSDSGCWAGNPGCDEGAASSYADHRSSAGTRLRGKSCSAEESGAEHDEGRCVEECVGAMAVAVAISMFPSLSLMRHGYSRLPSFQSESAPRIGRASRSTDMFTSPSAHQRTLHPTLLPASVVACTSTSSNRRLRLYSNWTKGLRNLGPYTRCC
jgi:hypothetical protein